MTTRPTETVWSDWKLCVQILYETSPSLKLSSAFYANFAVKEHLRANCTQLGSVRRT